MNSQRLEEIRDNYQSWLTECRWRWFTTLKITSGRPSRRRAIATFDQWITEMAEREGSSRFRWARVLEQGIGGDHFHFHAVIGGVRSRMAHWGKRWQQLGGEALIETYNPEEAGVLYLLKTMKSSGDIDLDLKLPQNRR
jgi:hypothetical protein